MTNFPAPQTENACGSTSAGAFLSVFISGAGAKHASQRVGQKTIFTPYEPLNHPVTTFHLPGKGAMCFNVSRAAHLTASFAEHSLMNHVSASYMDWYYIVE